jgi:hypothetical protein
VRYADDFIVTGDSRELLEYEVRPLLEAFLNERGLRLPAASRVQLKVVSPLESFSYSFSFSFSLFFLFRQEWAGRKRKIKIKNKEERERERVRERERFRR